jgi:hypothetical protein
MVAGYDKRTKRHGSAVEDIDAAIEFAGALHAQALPLPVRYGLRIQPVDASSCKQCVRATRAWPLDALRQFTPPTGTAGFSDTARLVPVSEVTFPAGHTGGKYYAEIEIQKELLARTGDDTLQVGRGPAAGEGHQAVHAQAPWRQGPAPVGVTRLGAHQPWPEALPISDACGYPDYSVNVSTCPPLEVAGKKLAAQANWLGLWVPLRPLSRGEHVITFGGRLDAMNRDRKVTYRLCVE